jgi:hypothetical protein
VPVGEQHAVGAHREGRGRDDLSRRELHPDHGHGPLVALHYAAVVDERRRLLVLQCLRRVRQLLLEGLDLFVAAPLLGGSEELAEPSDLGLRVAQRSGQPLDLSLQRMHRVVGGAEEAVRARLDPRHLRRPSPLLLVAREHEDGSDHDDRGQQAEHHPAELAGLAAHLDADALRGADPALTLVHGGGGRRVRRPRSGGHHPVGRAVGHEPELQNGALFAEPDLVRVVELGVAGDAVPIHQGAVAAPKVPHEPAVVLADDCGVSRRDVQVTLRIEAQVAGGVTAEADVRLREYLGIPGPGAREDFDLGLHGGI